jgi:hypothetical protein
MLINFHTRGLAITGTLVHLLSELFLLYQCGLTPIVFVY